MSSKEETEEQQQELSQPVEITEIQEEEDEMDEDSRTLDSADIQSIDSEKNNMPNPIDLGDSEDDNSRQQSRNAINKHAPAPSRSPPPSHQYLHTECFVKYRN